MGKFEALLVQAIEDFQADAGAPGGAGFLPADHGGLAGGDQGLEFLGGHRFCLNCGF